MAPRRAAVHFRRSLFRRPKDRSAWVLPTSEGIILIDTTVEYESEDVIVGGIKKLGFDPASVNMSSYPMPIPGRWAGQN